MGILSKYWKNYRDRKELKKSNYGRDFGWYIEYQNNIIGELIYNKPLDMFWCSYDIIAKDEKWEKILFNEKMWEDYQFKFLNKKYHKYAENAFSRFPPNHLKETKTVGMRMLYLTEL